MLSFICQQMEIGQVYLENRHAYMNKWLLLSDEEAEMKGAKGYLKMCVCIVGPGDDAPVWLFYWKVFYVICTMHHTKSDISITFSKNDFLSHTFIQESCTIKFWKTYFSFNLHEAVNFILK